MWTSERDVDALCEEILLSSGLRDEAYARHGLCANREGTYLATFRAVVKKYPHSEAWLELPAVRFTFGHDGECPRPSGLSRTPRCFPESPHQLGTGFEETTGGGGVRRFGPKGGDQRAVCFVEPSACLKESLCR